MDDQTLRGPDGRPDHPRRPDGGPDFRRDQILKIRSSIRLSREDLVVCCKACFILIFLDALIFGQKAQSIQNQFFLPSVNFITIRTLLKTSFLEGIKD